MNTRRSTLFATLVAVSLLLSACAAAAPATPAPQAPAAPAQPPQLQPPASGNQSPAQPARPATQPTQAARATSAPAAAAEAPKDALQQPPAVQAPAAQAPAAGQPCCAPTPWPTYPPQRAYTQYPFMDTREDHLSTFAMDVDTASYTKMRDYIHNGQLPPIDLVRVEEYLNYFKREAMYSRNGRSS